MDNLEESNNEKCDFCKCCNADDKVISVEVFVGFNETPTGYNNFFICEKHLQFYCVMCKFITWDEKHLSFDDQPHCVCMDCARKIIKLHM